MITQADPVAQQKSPALAESFQPSKPVEKRSSFTYKGKAISYLLIFPAEYFRGAQTWPLLVFLHGSSLRGNNLDLLKQYGPPLIASEQANFPLVVLAPQCPEGEAWKDGDGLAALIDEVKKQNRIDSSRVYLSGMSLGGSGVWYLAAQHPEYFAAMVPVAACQTVNAAGAEKVKNLPVWSIHGEEDTVCPKENSEKTISYLRSIGSEPRFTVLTGKGHYITSVFKNAELYEWLLQHRRPSP